jgi:catechol 2,3-dioxygenase-like lactoylglutathione lyase family enzyme
MPVEDTERAVEFYGNTLGLSEVKRDGDWVEYELDGMRIGLNGREPGGAGVEGGPVLTFQPGGGIEAAIEDLESKGVEAGGISDHEWGRVATFKDSEGNDLQLYEPPRS